MEEGLKREREWRTGRTNGAPGKKFVRRRVGEGREKRGASEREHVKFSKVAEHRDKRKVGRRRGKRGRTRWTGLGEQWNPMKRGKKEREKGKKKKIKKNLAKRIQYGAPYVHDRKE